MTGMAKTSALFASFALAGLLAACGPGPRAQDDMSVINPVVPLGFDPVTGQPTGLSGALNNKEPDTCKAADYLHLVGMTETDVAAAAIDRPTRMVTPNSIVDQEEYDSFRINFHTDATGRIFRITCG